MKTRTTSRYLGAYREGILEGPTPEDGETWYQLTGVSPSHIGKRAAFTCIEDAETKAVAWRVLGYTNIMLIRFVWSSTLCYWRSTLLTLGELSDGD